MSVNSCLLPLIVYMPPCIKINACPHLCIMVGIATATTGGGDSSVVELSCAVVDLF